ncbi:hypothetical protein PTKIN_Ptkin15bG0027300 [Pterospermum kingtungense]
MIFFTLLFSGPKFYELLFSLLYEYFIVVAKSRHLVAVFFMFTVIIISNLFVISPKLRPSDYQDAAAQFMFPDPASDFGIDAAKYEENSDSYEELEDDNNDDDGEEDDRDQDIIQEDEKDNDLEKRIEEFIAKVTRKWREELLADSINAATLSSLSDIQPPQHPIFI